MADFTTLTHPIPMSRPIDLTKMYGFVALSDY